MRALKLIKMVVTNDILLTVIAGNAIGLIIINLIWG